MLVLSRKVGESVRIDGTIEVTVLRFDGRRVRLGIEAPKEIPVIRSELIQSSDVSLDELPTGNSPAVDLVGGHCLVDQEMGSGI